MHYVATDFLGTPRSVVDDKGQQVWKWRSGSEPFGDSSPEGSYALALRFPGQYVDAETGLYYNLQRFYHPGIGRYLQSDPIGLAGGMNTYGYAKTDPLSRSDFSGLVPNPLEIACPFGGPYNPVCDVGVLIDLGTTIGVAVSAGVATSAILVTPGDSRVQSNVDRNIRWPDKIPPGQWVCKARADCNDNIPDNCPADISKRFMFGGGVSNNLFSARKIAQSNAISNLQCQPKHVSCKCRNSKGEDYSGGC